MARLAVNVDHVATIRQARGADYPDPVAAAAMAELSGADGVVVHLRSDRRHISDRDVALIRQVVKTKLILEMAATPEMLGIAERILPHQVTLVPEKPEEITTEGGLNLAAGEEAVANAVRVLKNAGILVSLFIDPVPEAARAAKRTGADIVELHTGAFCDEKNEKAAARLMGEIAETARVAYELGLTVHAGHGIQYHNIRAFAGVREIEEFSIGHSIIGRAVFTGLEKAVAQMAQLAHGL